MGLGDFLHDLLNHAAIGSNALCDLRYEDLVALAPAFHGSVLVVFRHRRRNHEELANVEREGLRHDLHIPLDAANPLGYAVQSDSWCDVSQGYERPYKIAGQALSVRLESY
jgi:hypothetical protein